MLLGAIADDFTGATDLCSMLVRGGMRTVQLIGMPSADMPAPDADAIVVALKSRTVAGAGGGGRIARRIAMAAGGRCAAVFLQVLLDLRQHRPGKYRSGGGRVDRCPGLRFRAGVPGVSDQCADSLSRPSVRRRQSVERERHGAPSADADDRREPRARAVAPDRGHGGSGPLRHRRSGRARDPRRDDRG